MSMPMRMRAEISIPVESTPEVVTRLAAANYVRRIPIPAQRHYGEDYLAWVLAGRWGSPPTADAHGVAYLAGTHIRATIEAQLSPPSRSGRRRR
jgi:hypothetical protein